MIQQEHGIAGEVFPNLWRSQNFILASTPKCSTYLLHSIATHLELEQLDWLQELNTGTSRKLLLGQFESGLPDLIFKRSKTTRRKSSDSFDPVSISDEIKANMKLANIARILQEANGFQLSSGFEEVFVRTEIPIGVLIDRRDHSRYSIFIAEGGFDTGERLQYTEPPIEGAINYNPMDWKDFCAVSTVLDILKVEAENQGLNMNDYNIHQTLYYADEEHKRLEIVLIDTERVRIVS